jgi:hypothetical protein
MLPMMTTGLRQMTVQPVQKSIQAVGQVYNQPKPMAAKMGGIDPLATRFAAMRKLSGMYNR